MLNDFFDSFKDDPTAGEGHEGDKRAKTCKAIFEDISNPQSMTVIFKKRGLWRSAICDHFDDSNWGSFLDAAIVASKESDSAKRVDVRSVRDIIIQNGHHKKMPIESQVKFAVWTRSRVAADYALSTGAWLSPFSYPGDNLSIESAFALYKAFPDKANEIFKYSKATKKWDIIKLVNLAVKNECKAAANFALERGWVRHYPGDDLKPKEASKLVVLVPERADEIFERIGEAAWAKDINSVVNFAVRGHCKEAAIYALSILEKNTVLKDEDVLAKVRKIHQAFPVKSHRLKYHIYSCLRARQGKGLWEQFLATMPDTQEYKVFFNCTLMADEKQNSSVEMARPRTVSAVSTDVNTIISNYGLLGLFGGKSHPGTVVQANNVAKKVVSYAAPVIHGLLITLYTCSDFIFDLLVFCGVC